MNARKIIALIGTLVMLSFSSCSGNTSPRTEEASASGASSQSASEAVSARENDPLFDESSGAFCIVNRNVPFFFDSELTAEPFSRYSELDSLGRCGAAVALIGKETLPIEERGKIGNIRPSGWHMEKYDIVEGKYLYNRCHLIGYQLSGENANERNLITGTRYLNVIGMLPFENRVAEYVSETGNHVLYRVTPKFDKDNLLADGVLIEARSVEDNGAGLEFCVFCYNIQPGITIDYRTGESKLDDGTPFETPETPTDSLTAPDSAVPASAELSETDGTSSDVSSGQSEAESSRDEQAAERDYIVNTGTKRFHLPECESVGEIREKNKYAFHGTRTELIENGYKPCGRCSP